MPTTESQIQSSYTLAKERYAALGVDTEAAMQQLQKSQFPCNAGRVMM